MKQQRVIYTKRATDGMNETGDYMMVFFHNVTNFNFFKTEKEFLFANSNTKYSLFGYLDNRYMYDGKKFEFLLEYPDVEAHFFWTQTVNPWHAQPNSYIGYVERGKSGNPQATFAGLTKYDGNLTFMDGVNKSNNWYYAVGTRTAWNDLDAMPALYWKSTPSIRSLRIWLRVPSLSFIQSLNFSRCTCKAHVRSVVSFSLSLCILLVSR